MSDYSPTPAATEDWSSYDGYSDGDSGEVDLTPSEAPDEGTADAGAPEGLPVEVEADETDANDEPRYVVKVDGEDVEVSLSELLAGYSRTSDYTKKTQTLAEQRRALAEAEAVMAALERDPARTLAALARNYGVGLPTSDPQDEYLSDEQRAIRDLQVWRDHVDAQQREAQLDAQLSALRQQYGDFSEDDLFSYAVQTETMNLETALRAMLWDRAVEVARAKQQPAPKTVEKRKAAAVATGAPRSGVAAPVEAMEIRSFRDAYEYAKRVQST